MQSNQSRLASRVDACHSDRGMCVTCEEDVLDGCENSHQATGATPPQSSEEAAREALGMEVHTDSSVISILREDESGGLEIMKGEEWFCVKPVANTLIVNLGDMMQVNKVYP